jgi:hypothetical protein
MTSPSATPVGSFCRHVLERFGRFDVGGDGRISRRDVLRAMQEPALRGTDAAALVALRQATDRRALGDSCTPERLRRVEARAECGEGRPAEWQGLFAGLAEFLAAPELNRSLYRGDGAECWKGIHQGWINDCWFVSAVIALARFRPAELRSLVRPNGGAYDVAFPGRRPVRGVFVTDAEIARYRRPHNGSDGLLLPVLEKAYGRLLNPETLEPFEAINREAVRAGKGIRLLTGRRSHTYYLTRGPFGWWQEFLRRRLEAAVRESPPSLVIASNTNFRTGHLFAVVGYDVASAVVTLQDPYASEPQPPLPLERFVKEYTFLFMEDTRR